MANLEETQADFIKQTAREVVQNSRIGHVVEVYVHIEEDDDSNFEADVNFPGEEDLEHRVAPISGPHGGSISVPKVGDKVLVQYLHGDKKVPVISNTFYTNKDRPPVGEAGMWRQRMDAGDSPAGKGDLYFTSHERYNKNPALHDYHDLTPEQAFVRIAKKTSGMDESGLPMSLELVDDAKNGEAYVKFEANKVGGADSSVSYGFKVDLTDGSFKIVDGKGYGIESDGNGNFTWHHENIDFSEGTTTSL